MRRAFLTTALCGCFFSACANSPVEPEFPKLDPQDGMLEGVVDRSTFLGTGMFGGTPDVRMGFGGNFQFSSIGVGKSDDESIYGVWHDGVIPPPGSYSVSFPSPFQRGFWLFYMQQSGDGLTQYAAYSGTIEIDSSSVSEVSGSFHVSARSCWESPCTETSGEATETETIELSGTFRLVPFDPLFVPL